MDATFDPYHKDDSTRRPESGVPASSSGTYHSERPGPARKRARGADDDPQKAAAQALPRVVRPLSHPLRKTLCAHYMKSDCRWGDECRFAHSEAELRVGAPVTEGMDFKNLQVGHASRSFQIPTAQARDFMTEATRRLLVEVSGGCGITWEPSALRVCASGTPAQLERAAQHVKRVTTHCRWGVSEAKIHGILRQQEYNSIRVRLSPIATTLKQVEVTLNSMRPQLTLGSGANNDLRLRGPLISRAHAVLEFIPKKGAIYICDVSTNGTFLNGVSLPAKSSGKVVLWHGDELLFPEPGKPVKALEYGYMVNLEMM